MEWSTVLSYLLATCESGGLKLPARGLHGSYLRSLFMLSCVARKLVVKLSILMDQGAKKLFSFEEELALLGSGEEGGSCVVCPKSGLFRGRVLVSLASDIWREARTQLSAELPIELELECREAGSRGGRGSRIATWSRDVNVVSWQRTVIFS